MKTLLACLLLTASAMSAPADSTFLQEVQRLEALYGGHLGVMVKDLNTGKVLQYNATERFPTASTIKFPVMVAFFDQVASGVLDPTMPVVLTDEDKKPGSGIIQFLSDGDRLTLLDAVKLMIIVSDNTGTNLVLDRLGSDHASRMEAVNSVIRRYGLKGTELLNRLYSWQTKKTTPESIRYGIGMSTPEDMVTLLEKLYTRTLVDSASSEAMIAIMKDQLYNDMIPRLLPSQTCKSFAVAHKTGFINESKIDLGLVLSDRANLAIAIFVDKHPDHEEALDNRAFLLAAHVARAAWNFFTGDTGYERVVNERDVDWNQFPGGKWAIYRSPFAPFPHPARENGFRTSDGTFYPRNPHYADNSITVFVPEGFTETPEGSNIIVHFHGHRNDNMGVLEQYKMPQAMIATRTNALLVLPQGPYRVPDSFCGKMEDSLGFRNMVQDVMETMKKEGIVSTTTVRSIIVTAHSGGYEAAAAVLDRGGLNDKIADVFLFDAFYGGLDKFRAWLVGGRGELFGAYTEHLAKNHQRFEKEVGPLVGKRLHFGPASVSHDEVVEAFFAQWLGTLGSNWRIR